MTLLPVSAASGHRCQGESEPELEEMEQVALAAGRGDHGRLEPPQLCPLRGSEESYGVKEQGVIHAWTSS